MMSTYVVLLALTTAVLLGAAWWRHRQPPVPQEIGWDEVLAASDSAGRVAVKLGYRRVYRDPYGFPKWQETGLPVITLED